MGECDSEMSVFTFHHIVIAEHGQAIQFFSPSPKSVSVCVHVHVDDFLKHTAN